MNDLILTQVPLSEIINQVREVVRQEIEQVKNKEMEEKLLSPSETCKLFQPNISKVTLMAWAKDGKLTPHKIGGRVYFKYSEVMGSLKTLKRYKKTIE